MALDIVVQRLQTGDVILVDLADQETSVEAQIVREPERTEGTVRARLRVTGRDDFDKEWSLGEYVTVIRGP